MSNTEQQSLKDLDDKLWKAADKLRSNLDAATAETWCLCALETYSEAAPAGRRALWRWGMEACAKVILRVGSRDA